MNYEFTKHAKDIIQERGIKLSWIEETINKPERTEFINNEELHYVKQIKGYGNRYFRVAVNPYSQPQKIITCFFDRRLNGKNNETKS